MGWFSPIKGHYPSLGQIDMSLPVAADDGNEVIERGMIIAVTDKGEFKIATGDEDLLYISLQNYTDAQAGMAGTVGLEPKGDAEAFVGNVPTVGLPKITGLSLRMEGEYETSVFTGITDTTPIGTPLKVSSGMLTPAGEGETPVAYLTGKVASRWVNNATSKIQGNEVVRQGGTVSVIRFSVK